MFGKKKDKPKSKKIDTRIVSVHDIRIGQRFVDIDYTIYRVEEKREFRKGSTALLAVYGNPTNNSTKAAGWFTRENYLVVTE